MHLKYNEVAAETVLTQKYLEVHENLCKVLSPSCSHPMALLVLSTVLQVGGAPTAVMAVEPLF